MHKGTFRSCSIEILLCHCWSCHAFSNHLSVTSHGFLFCMMACKVCWCQKSLEKEGYAFWFWYTTRALIYSQEGVCNSDCCKKFLIDARKFLVKMFEVNLISFRIIMYVSVLDPKVFVSQLLDVCKSMCQSLLYTLVHMKMIWLSQADQAMSEFLSFFQTSTRGRKASFESFQKKHYQLDDFYAKETDIGNCKNLLSVFKLALC